MSCPYLLYICIYIWIVPSLGCKDALVMEQEGSTLFCSDPPKSFGAKAAVEMANAGIFTKWFQQHSEMPAPFILARLRERYRELPAARSFP